MTLSTAVLAVLHLRAPLLVMSFAGEPKSTAKPTPPRAVLKDRDHRDAVRYVEYVLAQPGWSLHMETDSTIQTSRRPLQRREPNRLVSRNDNVFQRFTDLRLVRRVVDALHFHCSERVSSARGLYKIPRISLLGVALHSRGGRLLSDCVISE